MRNFLNVNWAVRLRNPLFIAQIFTAFITPIGMYYGIEAKDVTSWSIAWHYLLSALGNPYVVVCILVGVYNAIPDPTTHGPGDSNQALNYVQPRKY